MLIPARGKAIVAMYHLEHPNLFLPEDSEKPELSIAEVLESSNGIAKGSKILMPTKAGLPIKDGEEHYRLINESDIIAIIDDDDNE